MRSNWLARQAGVGRGRAHLAVEVVRAERTRAGRAPHVLGQHVERAGAVQHGVLGAGGGRLDGGAALQHLEAVARHQHGARGLVEAMVGAADALDQAARALRRADVDDEIDVAPVDAEVERGGGDHGLERAGRHGRFHLAAARGIERAVMQGDRQVVVVDAPQLLEQQLGLAARVDEHQRQVVRLDGREDLGQRVAGGVPGPGQRRLGLHHGDLGPRAALDLHQVGELHGAGARLRHQVGAQFARPRHGGRQADAHVARRDASAGGRGRAPAGRRAWWGSAHAARRG